jgi:hypothetical protein
VRSRRSFTATSIGFANLADSRARAPHFYRAIAPNSKAAARPSRGCALKKGPPIQRPLVTCVRPRPCLQDAANNHNKTIVIGALI